MLNHLVDVSLNSCVFRIHLALNKFEIQVLSTLIDIFSKTFKWSEIVVSIEQSHNSDIVKIYFLISNSLKITIYISTLSIV